GSIEAVTTSLTTWSGEFKGMFFVISLILSLFLRVAEDIISAVANKGMNKPYFRMATFGDLCLCNINILLFINDLLKKLLVRVLTGTPNARLSSSNEYSFLSP